ncbi:MAG: DUF420 domain-containing protein [Leeuwenhoekiella sp.]
MSETAALENRKYNTWIIVLSIAIPLAVAVLFTVRIPGVERLGFLPPIYATINGITSLLLIAAVIAIKNGKRKTHENLMKTAIACSVLFLLMYVTYHATSDSTKFGDLNLDGMVDADELQVAGNSRYIYFFILLSHIVLSVGVIPFVLVTYVRAIRGKFRLHRKVAKITFPIWLYVAVTGVIVYFMISPYYPV